MSGGRGENTVNDAEPVKNADDGGVGEDREEAEVAVGYGTYSTYCRSARSGGHDWSGG